MMGRSVWNSIVVVRIQTLDFKAFRWDDRKRTIHFWMENFDRRFDSTDRFDGTVPNLLQVSLFTNDLIEPIESRC